MLFLLMYFTKKNPLYWVRFIFIYSKTNKFSRAKRYVYLHILILKLNVIKSDKYSFLAAILNPIFWFLIFLDRSNDENV